VQLLCLPAIQAQLALDRKDPAAALNTLRTSADIELGQIQFVNNISCLYSTYIRGEAYLAAGQGKESAAEFQKIIDHSESSGIAGREPWRIWAWRVRMLCSRKLRKARIPTPHKCEHWRLTKTSLPYGKMPTATSPF
jgi:hypothetical protein